MNKIARGIIAAVVVALLASGCTPAEEATPSVVPIPTASASPTPSAEPGTRANPLPAGEMVKLSPASVWTVGAFASTVTADGYLLLPLHIEFDWEAMREQGADPETEGADPSYSLTVEYITAAGRSFTTMDNYDVANEWYEVGVVYPPATSVDVQVPISVPADQVAGGVWKIANSAGAAVFIVGG